MAGTHQPAIGCSLFLAAGGRQGALDARAESCCTAVAAAAELAEGLDRTQRPAALAAVILG